MNKNWFKWKWLAWLPGSRNLNPFSSVEWTRAIEFTGELPPELTNFKSPLHLTISLNWVDRSQEWITDVWEFAISKLKHWRAIWRSGRS